ncbi:MAG: hypothetical protein V7607_3902 [Solirubrobacteraceae bacterium]
MRGAVRSVGMKLAALAGLAASLTAIALAASASATNHPTGVVETCAHQSGASFPRGFTSRDNLVVGPLAMIGGRRFTDAATVGKFGGNKFPLLVAAGHTVRIEVTRASHRFASLAYGSHSRVGHRVMTFRSCSRDDAASDADDKPVTFWSGFVEATRPGCVRLRIWVDRERTPRRARIELGARC